MTDAPLMTVTCRVEASPERVYDAWLDPKIAGKFLFATPNGTMVTAETDPQVGGRFRFTDRREGMDIEHLGEYLELDRPRRIVFSFSVMGHPTGTPVTLDIAPVECGGEVTLSHRIEPEWAEFAERTRAGWTMILDGLKRVIEG
jgi:uncharacterized protein YndB with AHSA1/START domain